MEDSLEEMSSFFDKRIETYEEHMMTEVNGAKEAYLEIAKYIPEMDQMRLVDLGCGTGLELEEIYKKSPSLLVTAIDLSKEMLAKLREKYVDKNIKLNKMSYFDFNYGEGNYEAALSCMTLHHFTPKEKIGLYQKLYNGLVPGGRYVECDYMLEDQELEDFYFAESKRIREENGIVEGIYHYDTPCTVENQIKMLLQAGFSKVEKVWKIGNTTILVCYK